jgi:hypothetical protein
VPDPAADPAPDTAPENPTPPIPPSAEQHPAPAPRSQPASAPLPDAGAPAPAPVPGATPPAANPLAPVLLVLQALTVRDRVVAVAAGLGAYVAAYLVGVLSLVLTGVLAVAAAAGSGSGVGSGSGSSTGSPASGAPAGIAGIADAVGAIGNVLAGPAQLIALADLGRLGTTGTVTILGTGVTFSLDLGVVPVIVALAQLVVLVLVARLAHRRDQPFRVRLATSLISGLVLAAVSLLIGAVLSFRVPAQSGLSLDAISATTPGSILVAFLMGALATLLARPTWLVRLHPVVAASLGALRVASVHLGAFVVASGIALLLELALAGVLGAFAAVPLLIGNGAVGMAAVGMFGSISVSDSIVQLSRTLQGSSYRPSATSFSILDSATPEIWLLVVVAVLFALGASVALAVRRGGARRTTLDWALTPVAYALVGIVWVMVGTAVLSLHVSGANGVSVGGAGSFGITPWMPLNLAVWGVCVEVLARYVVPRVMVVGAGAPQRLLARLVGRDAVVAPRAPRATRAAARAPVDALVGSAGAEVAATADADGFAAAPGGAVPGAAAVTPMSPRARRILIRSSIIGGACLVVIIGLSITAGVLRSTVWGPGAAATTFVQDIADGDASAAGAMAQIDGMGSGMLTDQVLQAATGRISDVEVGVVRQDGDRADTTVTYQQGGVSHTTTLILARVSTQWLIQDQWQITSSLAGDVEISVSPALEGAAITANGLQIGTVQHQGSADYTSQRFPAFPGDYTIAVAGNDYLTGPSSAVTVAEGHAVPLRLEVTPTEKLTSELTKSVQDTITSCAARTDTDLPSDCPFHAPYSSGSGPVAYTVLRMPELSAKVQSDGSIEVLSTRSGQVGKKYVYDDGFASVPFQTTEPIYVDRTYTIVDGKLQEKGTAGS